MLPNFFVVGAQKAGTTTLHNHLAEHPQIFLPAQKETKFFVADDRYDAGIAHYEELYYGAQANEPAVGEVDPDYLYFESALDRMAEHIDLESVKFIFVLRNPVERAFSHYLMTYRRGLEPLSFSEAVEREPLRIARGYSGKMHYSYVDRGYYLRQIERFLRRIDRKHMHFILTEDLQNTPSTVLKDIFVFLGVDPDFVPTNVGVSYHGASVPRSMTLLKRITGPSPEKRLVRLLLPWPRLRHGLRQWLLEWNQTASRLPALSHGDRIRLIDLFAEENTHLAHFLQRDLSHWNEVGHCGERLS